MKNILIILAFLSASFHVMAQLKVKNYQDFSIMGDGFIHEFYSYLPARTYYLNDTANSFGDGFRAPVLKFKMDEKISKNKVNKVELILYLSGSNINQIDCPIKLVDISDTKWDKTNVDIEWLKEYKGLDKVGEEYIIPAEAVKGEKLIYDVTNLVKKNIKKLNTEVGFALLILPLPAPADVANRNILEPVRFYSIRSKGNKFTPTLKIYN